MAEVDDLLKQLRALIERAEQLVAQASEIPSPASLGRSARAMPRFTWERPEFFPGGGGLRVMYQAVSPVTHKSVCSCGCSADLSSDHKNVVIDVQTFEGEADCGSLNGAKCTKGGWTGKLVACTKESVPVGREAVQEDRPLVMG